MADLASACFKSMDLRRSFPCKPDRVLEGLRSVLECLCNPGLDILPEPDFDFLSSKVKSLSEKVSEEFQGHTDQPVPEESDIYRGLIELDTHLDAVRRHLIGAGHYKAFNEHLGKIAAVLPSSHYDFKPLLKALDEEKLGPRGRDICSGLKESLEKFQAQEYKDCLSRAAKTSNLLEEHLCAYIQKVFQTTQGIEDLHSTRKCLWGKTGKTEGRGRLEWLAVSLIEVSIWIRNVEAHSETDKKIPLWMDVRRRELAADPELARLALICELHAALQLQELRDKLEDEAAQSANQQEAPGPDV